MVIAKSLVIIFLASAVFNLKHCSDPNADFIVWRKSKKLTREDFNGTRPDSSNASAGSSVQIRLNYVLKGSLTHFDVRCLFFKNKSWLVSSDTTNAILIHEQGHFDIGEVFARKLRKELSQKIKDKIVISPRKMDSIYHVYTKGLVDLQNLYDDETNHSLVISEQERWNLEIQKMLDSLNSYRADKF